MTSGGDRHQPDDNLADGLQIALLSLVEQFSIITR
jgi:hypothetical protein